VAPSTGECRVWRAEPDEAETVGRLLSEFRTHLGERWPSDNAILATVERLIERPDCDFLLGAAHDDAPPGGVCQLRFRPSVWTASDDCLLEDLFVRESDRRNGLGAALVDTALARARERSCRRVELDVNESNSGALALYESVGFSARTPRYEGRNLLMSRWLQEPPER
jgi:ribosomal protein S18 acetylase RimI-like enzyme